MQGGEVVGALAAHVVGGCREGGAGAELIGEQRVFGAGLGERFLGGADDVDDVPLHAGGGAERSDVDAVADAAVMSGGFAQRATGGGGEALGGGWAEVVEAGESVSRVWRSSQRASSRSSSPAA